MSECRDAADSCVEEVAFKLEKDRSAFSRRVDQHLEGQGCWRVHGMLEGSFVVGADVGQRAGPGRRALNVMLKAFIQGFILKAVGSH